MAGLQEAEFLRDVEKHEMLVLRDDGIYQERALALQIQYGDAQ